MHPAKRARRGISAVMLVLLGFGTAIGASGCTAQEKTPPATPSPTPASTAPVLPTNEEALAIVEELVPRFLAAEAAVTSGEEEVDSLEALTTPEHLSAIRESVETLKSQGRKSVGVSSIDELSIQSVDTASDGIVIRAYGCYNMSGFDLVDSAGVSVRAPDVPNRFTVVFEVIGADGIFKSNGSEPWSGTSSCL